MLTIRLRPSGKKHEPHYRIVIQEKRSKLNGKYIESLGHYHPLYANENKITINADRIKYWLGQGAQTSDTITNLLVKENILDQSVKISRVYSTKKKDKAKAAEQAKEIKQESKEGIEEKAEEKTKEPEKEKVEDKVEVEDKKPDEESSKKPDAEDEKEAEIEEKHIDEESKTKTETEEKK